VAKRDILLQLLGSPTVRTAAPCTIGMPFGTF